MDIQAAGGSAPECLSLSDTWIRAEVKPRLSGERAVVQAHLSAIAVEDDRRMTSETGVRK